MDWKPENSKFKRKNYYQKVQVLRRIATIYTCSSKTYKWNYNRTQIQIFNYEEFMHRPNWKLLGAVCQSGGLNDKPDCLQFLNKFQKLYYINNLQNIRGSNCEVDQCMTLYANPEATSNTKKLNCDLDFNVHQQISVFVVPKENGTIRKNALEHIVGYFARYVCKNHKNCNKCET